jgi:hypothetical protein
VEFEFRTAAMTKTQCFWDVARSVLSFLDYIDPDDGGRKFLRNVGNYLFIDTVSYRRRTEF